MCVTLLLASLICLTLPGKLCPQTSNLCILLLSFSALCNSSHLRSHMSSSSFSASVCGSLADVFLDGQCSGAWTVHRSQWSVCLLAVYSSCHSAAVLDARGTDCHHAQSSRMDTHGNMNVSVVLPANGKYSSCISCWKLIWLFWKQILKTVVVALLLAGVIPLLLGLLFELVVVAPLRVPLDQTPLFYPWQVGLHWSEI